jgi:hypothetical protein
MPFNLQVIRTSDFVRLNGKGGYDPEETRQALSGIATACVQRGMNCALLDVREARSDMRMGDLYELALSFKQIGFRKEHRLAILHRSGGDVRVEFFAMTPGERAQFFAMCAADQGWNVKAFDDYEEAMDWLGTISPST